MLPPSECSATTAFLDPSRRISHCLAWSSCEPTSAHHAVACMHLPPSTLLNSIPCIPISVFPTLNPPFLFVYVHALASPLPPLFLPPSSPLPPLFLHLVLPRPPVFLPSSSLFIPSSSLFLPSSSPLPPLFLHLILPSSSPLPPLFLPSSSPLPPLFPPSSSPLAPLFLPSSFFL
ncbi:unnamed protein product [Closterium sp. Naga37s-1]|nr:unnamed protein product [Closterium sp. Naga37s-1]